MNGSAELDQVMTLAASLDIRIGIVRVGIEVPSSSPSDEEFTGSLAIYRSHPGGHELRGGFLIDDGPGGLAVAARAMHENIQSLVREREPH